MPGILALLMAGPNIPLPVGQAVADAIESIEVTNTEGGRDGFQIVLTAGKPSRDGLSGSGLDYTLLENPLLNTFNRVIVMVIFGFSPVVLIDGIITNRQFSPSSEPGQSKLTITGEDVSIMMDRKEVSTKHPNQSDVAIVSKIISSYPQYGLVPHVVQPPSMEVPEEADRMPCQHGTDLQYINALSETYDYVFYIEPTSVPGVNTAYWGPKQYTGTPQRALTVNMGSDTNVESINLQYSSLDSTMVTGSIMVPILNATVPFATAGSLRPALSGIPDLAANLANAKIKRYMKTGVDFVQAYNEAQAETDRSTDALTVTGKLDGVAYGDVLRARRPVSLRGVGRLHDGHYYVKSVTHNIRKGEYSQSFILVREGLGSTTQVVTP